MLNTFDGGSGATRAACRLNDGMRSRGIDSRLLTSFRSADAPNILPEKSLLGYIAPRARLILDSLPVKCYPKRQTDYFWPALLPDAVVRKTARLAPDLVHLHWITAGLLRIESLPKFRKPLVWTLHDSWAFTGGCNVPGECERYRQKCGACPLLGSSRESDLSRWIWKRKIKAWRGMNLTVVAPSRWMAKRARQSSIFSETPVEVIPNGLDISLFRPVDKRQARERLGLPPDRRLVLFGAFFSTDDPNKGFSILLQALRTMAENGWGDQAEVVVFGASAPDRVPQFGMHATYLGNLHDDQRLARLYAAADVFVAPSLQENLPYTVMEAMACGTPCVAFNQGGMPDLIDHQQTGWLARPFEPAGLARGIAWVLEDDGRRRELSARSRRKVEREFAMEEVSRRYVDLYGKLA